MNTDDILEILCRVSRIVPNEDFIKFDDAVGAVADLIKFRDKVEQISEDFHPDRDSDAPLALGEMRSAICEALSNVTGPPA